MNRLRLQLALCLLLLARLALAAGQAPASRQALAAVSSWDETQLQLLRQYSTPLRWDNVEGSPEWVSGPKPRRYLIRRLHLIRLRAGEEVVLRGTADSWLRLAADRKTLRPADLEISLSTDGRAFAEIPTIKSIDPDSLLLPLPQNKPALIRLTRPAQAKSILTFAAYFSRAQPFPGLAPYRTAVSLPGQTTRLRRDDEAASEPARLLEPGTNIQISVHGPARLQLVARLGWPSTESLREESSTVEVQLDDANPFPLLLCPELDDRHRTRVNHSVKLVSNRMDGFYEVPAGKHRVRLQSTSRIYLSVFRQPHPDFLLPWLNAPVTHAKQPLQPFFVTVPPASPYETPGVPLDDNDFVQREQEAFRLASDNTPLDAGAQAPDWLNRIAQTRQDYPAARMTFDTLWRQRTFYRELSPEHLPPGQPLRQALFCSTRLLDLFAPHWPVAVFNPTLEQICGSLVQGGFAPVAPPVRSLVQSGPFDLPSRALSSGEGEGEDGKEVHGFEERNGVSAFPSPGLTYELPRRTYDSELRIAALASACARAQFFVQFDQEIPVQITLDPVPAVPAHELEPSPAFATLRVIERAPEVPATFGSGLPVDEFDFPLPMISPGTVELPLPQHVRQVRIYQGPQAAPLLASVGYRAAKPFELGEADYLPLLDRCGPSAGFQMLSNPQTNAQIASESLRWLHNQYLPLIRLIRSHSNDFTKSVELSGLPLSNSSPSLLETTASLTASAERFKQRGHPIDALDIWNRLFWAAPPSSQSPLALAVMRDLESLGEEYLAEQYARVALLTSPEAQVPSAAIALLEDSAKQADDTEELEQVRALVFLRCPCAPHLAGLSEALALNSNDEMALMSGLLLPAGQRPADTMLAAALHLNWWQTFDRLVEELPDSKAKDFWRAQKHLAFFHFNEAEKHLKQAGARGVEMLEALRQGRYIRKQLSAANLPDRFDALLAWEQWLAHQPGPTIWQAAPELVSECSGTEALFNCELNDVIAFFRVEPGRPLKLRFLGPARLQLEARPVLNTPFAQPVDDWVEIAEYGLTNRVPICQCIPNPSLQFTSRTNALVGIKTLADLDWGPGWHEVDVSLAARAGLIRVRVAQPVLPLRVLPALSPKRMEFVLRAGPKSSPAHKRGGAVAEASQGSARTNLVEARWSPHDERTGYGEPTKIVRRESGIWWVSASSARQPTHSQASVALETDALTQIQNLRLALRVPLEPAQPPGFDAPDLQTLPLNEQWLAVCRWQRWSDFAAWDALPESDRVNYWLATGHIQQVLDSGSPRDLLQRFTTLLQVSELFPPWREEAQCLAELLPAQTNCPPGFKKILVRITQKRTWDPLAVSPVSAGVLPLVVQSDWAQDPSLRIRRALLPPGLTNQFTIADQSVYTATMELQHPADVRVLAELTRAGFSPLAPLTVSLQIDARQPQQFALTPLSSDLSTNFALPEGQHLLRMWIEDPVVNQCVRIGFSGTTSGVTNSVWSESFADMATEKRFFFGATASQPVRFSRTGPALLRLDEWRDGALSSQYKFVPRGEQAIALPPVPGSPQSWFQVFVRSTQTNQPDTRPAWAIRDPERVPPPQLLLPDSDPPAEARLTDYYRLGGQEDGTWTASGLLAHRYPFEPGGKQNSPLNEFVQASAAYRKAAPSETLWFDSEALGRVHRQGDVTLGLSEYIEGHPQVLPIEWAWSGEAFLGWVDPHQSELAASLYTTLEIGQRRHLSRKLDWYPFAGLFAHHLSLSPAQAKTLTYLDQDLYTTYRHNHLWGGVLGNELEYLPWLDTALKAAVEVTSNEDFSADHWGMGLSWDQLFGPFRGEVAYLFTQWLVDSNRKTASLLQGVAAGLYGELWLNGCNRLEVGGQYRHDWPGSGDSYFLVVSWDFSQGRGYRDYSPRKTKFLDLRSRRIPAAFNNSFQPDLPVANLP